MARSTALILFLPIVSCPRHNNGLCGRGQSTLDFGFWIGDFGLKKLSAVGLLAINRNCCPEPGCRMKGASSLELVD